MGLIEDMLVFVDPLVAQTEATDLFGAFIPQGAPATLTVIYEYSGRESRRSFGGGRDELPRIQVACRGTNYSEVKARALTIHNAMEAVNHQSINGTTYKVITPLQTPFPLGGKNENDQYTIVFNAEVEKQA